MATATTAPRAIPGAGAGAGASVDGQRQQREISTSSVNTLDSSNTGASASTSTAARTATRPHSYVPRWDANGNSHHPIPSTSTVSSSTMSSKNSSSSNNNNDSSVATSPPSAILSLLGLTPSPKRSAALPLPPTDNHARHNHGHARNKPSTSSTTSTAYYYDTTQDNLLDGDFDDDDGPPEPITPPQSTLAPLTQAQAQAKLSKNAAIVVQEGGNRPARTATPTHFGNELDEASKFELDDVFDGNAASIGSMARSPPSTSAHSAGNNAAAGIPVSSSSSTTTSGRRASWSAASGNGTQHLYSASAPGTSLMSWLHSQQQSHSQNHHQAGASAGSSSYNNNNNADKTSLDLGRGARPIPIDRQHGATNAGVQTAPAKEAPDFGSSPVGLFRRLSLSYTNRRPPQVPAPPSTASQLSGDNNHTNADDPRIGRPLTRVTSAPPRKLSPMGERMLRAHYDSFS